MTKKLISILIFLVYLSPLVHARGYKCQSPNGSISFQDHPCKEGAASSAINLKPVQGYSDENQRHSFRNPSQAQRLSGSTPYPYARGDDVERLEEGNADLQARMARMKKENPEWQHSQTMTRLNAQAEALNAIIQANKKPAR